MPTRCRACLGDGLEYADDGSGRCPKCGTISYPAWHVVREETPKLASRVQAASTAATPQVRPTKSPSASLRDKGLSPGETKVALIPNIVVSGALGPKQYAILLTDQRSILVLESSSKVGLGAILGGAVGAAIAAAAATRRSIDFNQVSPASLAMDEKNLVIPHSSIRSIVLRKRFGGYQLVLEYLRTDGKVKEIVAGVAPPAEMVKQRKKQGKKPAETTAEYVTSVKESFRRALPPAIAGRATWDL